MTELDNDALTRVGPGTPMGDLMREYWIPVLESSDLPEPDGRIVRVRLLGEDLVAFRDSSGTVGLLAEHCSHRRASLFFGRNEECGLRCVYHGWKYDVTGRCVDMPNEPRESRFKDHIRHPAYQTREQLGVIWAYLGKREERPPLPCLEAFSVPMEQRYVRRTLRECNWLQALEGDIDSSHISFLHSVFDASSFAYRDFEYRHRDRSPQFSVKQTDYGIVYCATRVIDSSHNHCRVAHFLLPFYTIIPPNDPCKMHLSAWVPIDDENTQFWSIVWDPVSAIPEAEREKRGRVRPIPGFELDEYLPDGDGPLERGRLVGNKSNNYMIDYKAQMRKRFSGIPTFHLQDKAMTESMGAITERGLENLGKADLPIVQTRRRLKNILSAETDDYAARAPGVKDGSLYAVRSASIVVPSDANWYDASEPYLKAFTELPVAFVV